MSQAIEQQPSVSPAFKRAPVNPNARPPQTLSEQLPPPVPPDADIPVQPVPPVQMQPAPSLPVQTPVQPHQVDPQYMLAIQRMQQEQQRLIDESAAKDQTIQNLLSAQQEYETLRQRQVLQDALSKDAFAELETVDPADAQRISSAVLNATQSIISPVQKELEKTRQQVNEQFQQQQQMAYQRQAYSTNQRIMQAHPDFFELQSNPAYHTFMNQRDGLSSQSRDQRAAQEFSAGNADYIIDLLNQLKGAVPSATQIASVAPVQTASSVGVPAQAQQAPAMTLRELNSLYQMRQLSHDEYRAKLKELRAANNM